MEKKCFKENIIKLFMDKVIHTLKKNKSRSL